MVHIHYKLICSYLCSAEQNNKTSLKNDNECFIFMTEVDLCQNGKKVLFEYQIAVSQVVRQFFSVLQVAAVIFFSGYLWQQLSSGKIVYAGFLW